MKTLIAGNWKMNIDTDGAKKLIAAIVNGVENSKELMEKCDFLVCPPSLYIATIRHSLTGLEHVSFGGQDCSPHDNGPYTGDISAAMLKDKTCSHVIVGHSERREHHGETNELVAAKAAKANAHGLTTIICVGENEKQREQGLQEEIVLAQLKGSVPPGATAQNTVIAYEPVWAIGTGKTATPEEAGAMHDFIRKAIQNLIEDSEKVRIVYGGSLKPDNAAALLAQKNINGGLIGGASLDAEQFLAIAKAA